MPPAATPAVKLHLILEVNPLIIALDSYDLFLAWLLASLLHANSHELVVATGGVGRGVCLTHWRGGLEVHVALVTADLATLHHDGHRGACLDHGLLDQLSGVGFELVREAVLVTEKHSRAVLALLRQ